MRVKVFQGRVAAGRPVAVYEAITAAEPQASKFFARQHALPTTPLPTLNGALSSPSTLFSPPPPPPDPALPPLCICSPFATMPPSCPTTLPTT